MDLLQPWQWHLLQWNRITVQITSAGAEVSVCPDLDLATTPVAADLGGVDAIVSKVYLISETVDHRRNYKFSLKGA